MFGENTVDFGLGKNGAIAGPRGQEGDGKTPLGTYHLRFGFYRADRLPKPAGHPHKPLKLHAMSPDDGWCDDIHHPAYNRWIKRPFDASHEALWREDGAYDVILVMSHNDSPPRAPLGSAVFIHIRQPDHRPTLGCLALSPTDMLFVLRHAGAGTPVIVR